MTKTVRLETPQPHIGLITIDRPAVRNALDWDTMHALGHAIQSAAATPDLRVLILTGAGGHFISGGDLRALHGANTKADARRQYDTMSKTLNALESLPAITIAAMNGAARGGGCEVALACDLRIASADASMGFAQVSMGVTPGWGGAERLTRLIGPARTLDLLLTGRLLSAGGAEQLGLVNRVVDEQQAIEGAMHYAEHLIAMPPLALRGIKQVVQAYQTAPLEEARQTEADSFSRLWTTRDHAEASTAFLEKRAARFTGE